MKSRDVIRGFSRLSGQTLIAVGQSATGAVAGIIIVRGVPKDDYAVYAVCIALISALTDMADAGATTTLQAVGGRSISKGESALGGVLHAVQRFRVLTTLVFAIVVGWYGLVLLGGIQADFDANLILISAVLVCSLASGSSALNSVTLRLQYRFTIAGSVALVMGVVRLVAITALIIGLTDVPVVFILIATAAATGLEILIQRRTLGRLLLAGRVPRGTFTSHLIKNSRRQLPLNVFYVTQGFVLTTVLVSYGLDDSIADISALSRFSIGFFIASQVVVQIYGSQLARDESSTSARARFIRGAGVYLALGLVGIVALWLLRVPAISILGPQYSHLTAELLLVSVGGLSGSFAVALGGLNRSRAWQHRTWVYVPVTVVWTAFLLTVLHLDSTRSAAVFVALAPLCGIPVMLYSTFLGIRSERLSEMEGSDGASAPSSG